MAGHKGAGKGKLDIDVRDLGMGESRITVAGSGHGLEGVAKVQGGREGGLEAGTAGAAWVGGRFSETQSSMAAKELEVAMHVLTPPHSHTLPPPTHRLSHTQIHTHTVVSCASAGWKAVRAVDTDCAGHGRVESGLPGLHLNPFGE
jgi:hypothetical protein